MRNRAPRAKRGIQGKRGSSGKVSPQTLTTREGEGRAKEGSWDSREGEGSGERKTQSLSSRKLQGIGKPRGVPGDANEGGGAESPKESHGGALQKLQGGRGARNTRAPGGRQQRRWGGKPGGKRANGALRELQGGRGEQNMRTPGRMPTEAGRQGGTRASLGSRVASQGPSRLVEGWMPGDGGNTTSTSKGGGSMEASVRTEFQSGKTEGGESVMHGK